MTWIALSVKLGHRRTSWQKLAEITDVDESTINVLLQIDHNGEELLLPAAEELILSADHENKTLAVSIPEGLLDL